MSKKLIHIGLLLLFSGWSSLQAQGLRDGLVAEWNFDEASGLTASDSTGAHDGALNNFPDSSSHWVAGVHGGGIEFNGSNDVEVPDAPEIGADLVNGFTVAAWFRSNVDLDAGGGGNRMLEKGNAYFFLQGVANGGMNFLVKDAGANRTAGIGESLSANVWYHITGVFDGADAHVNKCQVKDGWEVAISFKGNKSDIYRVLLGDVHHCWVATGVVGWSHKFSKKSQVLVRNFWRPLRALTIRCLQRSRSDSSSFSVPWEKERAMRWPHCCIARMSFSKLISLLC